MEVGVIGGGFVDCFELELWHWSAHVVLVIVLVLTLVLLLVLLLVAMVTMQVVGVAGHDELDVVYLGSDGLFVCVRVIIVVLLFLLLLKQLIGVVVGDRF